MFQASNISQLYFLIASVWQKWTIFVLSGQFIYWMKKSSILANFLE